MSLRQHVAASRKKKTADTPLSPTKADRPIWSRLANAHHWRQMSQKRQYWVDRQHAAANPDIELYVAMDGGAGNDAVLPHLSAHDLELPNKALKDASTLPAKIMNGLVNGSVRSHVILSPGNLKTVRPSGKCHVSGVVGSATVTQTPAIAAIRSCPLTDGRRAPTTRANRC